MDSRWGARLVEWGYVALSVESYGPRGIKSTCGNFSAADPSDHMFDAYGALSFLAAQPFVASDHAAVMGGSGGATMALKGAALQSDWGLPIGSAPPSRSIPIAASSTGR
jgi:dienelactone hydrolase